MPAKEQSSKKKRTAVSSGEASALERLKGWQQIADFLGQPVSLAQRWAKTGMPVRREGRSMVATRGELTEWLGRELGQPVHLSANEDDLAAVLKRGLAYARQKKKE
jgi:hypothetical protein